MPARLTAPLGYVENTVKRGTRPQCGLRCSSKTRRSRVNLAVVQGTRPALDAIHSDREQVDQVEAFGVLGQQRSEHACDNVSEFWTL